MRLPVEDSAHEFLFEYSLSEVHTWCQLERCSALSAFSEIHLLTNRFTRADMSSGFRARPSAPELVYWFRTHFVALCDAKSRCHLGRASCTIEGRIYMEANSEFQKEPLIRRARDRAVSQREGEGEREHPTAPTWTLRALLPLPPFRFSK